jgi:hypothetical protein
MHNLKRLRIECDECDEHLGPQLAYIICKHMIAGAKPAHVELTTGKLPGVVLCADCRFGDPEQEIPDDDLMAVCAGCVERRGWLQ